MSEYPSQIEFMQAHIEALEAELKFFRSQFPTAARNWQKAAQQSFAPDEGYCRCRITKTEAVLAGSLCPKCCRPRR